MKQIKIIMILAILLVTGLTGLAQEKKTDTISIKTSAVCGQCKDRIETGMAFEKGVKDVKLDVDTKMATIFYATSKTTPDQLRRSISKLGYDADSISADPAAYKKLPACCKKDAAKH
ncbi:MAG: heavy-metal-associated domain-containing protein [bacterium]